MKLANLNCARSRDLNISPFIFVHADFARKEANSISSFLVGRMLSMRWRVQEFVGEIMHHNVRCEVCSARWHFFAVQASQHMFC